MQIVAYLFVNHTEVEVYPFPTAVVAEKKINFCYTARVLQKHVQEPKDNNYICETNSLGT